MAHEVVRVVLGLFLNAFLLLLLGFNMGRSDNFWWSEKWSGWNVLKTYGTEEKTYKI